MPLRVLTRLQYLEELNRRLQNHPDFEPGMRFVPAPDAESVDTATGYTWEPDGSAMHPFAGIATVFNTEVVVDG